MPLFTNESDVRLRKGAQWPQCYLTRLADDGRPIVSILARNIKPRYLVAIVLYNIGAGLHNGVHSRADIAVPEADTARSTNN